MGGEISKVPVLSWAWGEPTARLQIRTRNAGERTPRPARLHIADRDGHPVIPDSGQVWFDGQNGLAFFYSPGTLTVELPAGQVRIMAAAGFGSAAVSAVGQAVPGEIAALDLEFAPLWNSQAEGWYSGDHHFHLNYGGPYTLRPDDLVLMMRGEDLDVGTPLMANLQTRVNDLDWFNWAKLDSRPLIAFGQEIRPTFGHLGLIGISTPYWPWFWGPGYKVFGTDEWLNGEALAHARRQRGVNAYVHPVMRPGPFPGGGQAPSGLPLGLVPDAILGDVDTLEVACLWSDELGTTEAWYRLLNVGVPIAPSAGTDVMTDFYRTMAVGTTRVYVKPQGPLTLQSYLDALRAGRSFVSTGPQLLLTAAGAEPGEVLRAIAGGPVAWELTAVSPLAFETVEVLVNGVVAWKADGLKAPGRQTWKGTLTAPPGGWVAARVIGGSVQWPAMDSYPFAHTAPIWFGTVGSVDRAAARTAATELLQWMDIAQAQLLARYDGVDIPKLTARFEQARRRLEAIAAGGSTP
jgi:TolB protein